MGKIADSCGSKEGAKVGNTVGVVEKPKDIIGGWTYHGSALKLVITNYATRKSKVTCMVEPSSGNKSSLR